MIPAQVERHFHMTMTMHATIGYSLTRQTSSVPMHTTQELVCVLVHLPKWVRR